MSQLQQMNTIQISCTIPGDSSRKVGDKVEFLLPSAEPIDCAMVYDPYYSGYYLVIAVKHTVNRDKYFTTMQMIKDALSEPMPMIGQNETSVREGSKF